MSDLFHEEIPPDFLESVFDVIKRADHHIFQVLTKRSKRMVRWADKLDWPKNLWVGVTCESKQYRFRINDLRKIPAAVRFISFEPLLGPIPEVDLTDIHWAVIGGESGPGARPMREEWALGLLRQCRQQKVAFFFKQWGGVNKKKTGRELRGRYYSELPKVPQLQNGQLKLAI